MSELEGKLEQADVAIGTRARALLKKHLTYRNGEPRYTIVREDSCGPVIIQSSTMCGPLLWRRVYFDKTDILFETLEDGEDHVSYYAAPKQDSAPKKRARKTSVGPRKKSK